MVGLFIKMVINFFFWFVNFLCFSFRKFCVKLFFRIWLKILFLIFVLKFFVKFLNVVSKFVMIKWFFVGVRCNR